MEVDHGPLEDYFPLPHKRVVHFHDFLGEHQCFPHCSPPCLLKGKAGCCKTVVVEDLIRSHKVFQRSSQPDKVKLRQAVSSTAAILQSKEAQERMSV